MLAPAKMFPIILLGHTYLTSRTYATKRFQFSVYLLTCLPTCLATYTYSACAIIAHFYFSTRLVLLLKKIELTLPGF